MLSEAVTPGNALEMGEGWGITAWREVRIDELSMSLLDALAGPVPSRHSAVGRFPSKPSIEPKSDLGSSASFVCWNSAISESSLLDLPAGGGGGSSFS